MLRLQTSGGAVTGRRSDDEKRWETQETSAWKGAADGGRLVGQVYGVTQGWLS